MASKRPWVASLVNIKAILGRGERGRGRRSYRTRARGGHHLLNPDTVKRVTNAGTVRFKRRLVFIANSLKQHPIGLEEVDDGIWSIYFCRVLLGRIDERDYIIRTWTRVTHVAGLFRYRSSRLLRLYRS